MCTPDSERQKINTTKKMKKVNKVSAGWSLRRAGGFFWKSFIEA
jgi:hypothetical protein